MTMSHTTPQTNYDYFKELWRDSAPATKRKWRIFLAVLGGLWLGGAVTAFSNVAGIMRLDIGSRILASLLVGPFGLLWGFLKWTGLIRETIQEPNLFWLLLLGLNVGIIWLAGKILTGEPNQLVQQQRKQAAAEYAKAFRLNPVRVLLDMADCDPVTLLTALETVPAAKKYVRIFTDGLPPAKYYDNRFATSAYGTFTTMLNGYQKHIDTIAPRRNGPTVIPRGWAAQGATIYITYSLSDLQGVGGVVAAIVAAFMRYQLRQPKKERVLFAIDELPAVGLYNVTDYLAAVGGADITLLLYAQAMSQLRELYGREGTQSILANCVHQIWYPPADIETAKVMAELYGTAYKPTHTHSTSRRFYQGGQGDNGQRQNYVDMRQGQGWEIRPALEPGEIMSLPKEQVMVLTQKERQYRFFGRRLNPIPLFPHLAPPPAVPQFRSGPRQYTPWQPDGRSSTNGQQSDDSDSLASADHF